jgi:hypothetical protein
MRSTCWAQESWQSHEADGQVFNLDVVRAYGGGANIDDEFAFVVLDKKLIGQ